MIAVREIPNGEQRRALFLRYGELIEALGGTYRTSSDMNTNEADMDVIAERTKYVFGRSTVAAAATLGGIAALAVLVAALVALSFPAAVQQQNSAPNDCASSHDRGVVTVHWTSILPPRHVCAVNGLEVH